MRHQAPIALDASPPCKISTATRVTARSMTALRLLLLLCLVAPHTTDAACHSTCTEEYRACRQRCSAIHGRQRRSCTRACQDASTCNPPGNRSRTLVYVAFQCRQDANGDLELKERLLLRRGNCDPVTLLDLPPAGPVPDTTMPFTGGICRLYAQYHGGIGSVVVGRLQRVGVLPDESGVVFELTNDHSTYPPASPEPPEKGIFFVRKDGSGLRSLGPALQLPIIEIALNPASPTGIDVVANDNAVFNISPDSRLITYADVGFGPNGETGKEWREIFVIDLVSGERRQITHLPPTPSGSGPTTGGPYFSDAETILFWNGPEGAVFTVRPDGTRLERSAIPIPIPGATVTPQFQIIGGGGRIEALQLPGDPARRYGASDVIHELFLRKGRGLLQLTNFAYPDTAYNASAGPHRVFYVASADPLGGTNSAGMCQLFSVDNLGRHVHQVTHMADDGLMKAGCAGTRPGFSCNFQGVVQDPMTSLVGFVSTCDPVGRTRGGTQLFSIRPGGTGLRQTTDFRGVETHPDGSVTVESVGPAMYSALLF
jgi:hypothetical protein